MAISKTNVVGAKNSKSISSSKVNENPFTFEDVKNVLKERQDLIDLQSQQKELEKKQKILSKISDNSTQKTKVSAASLADILGFDPRKAKESAFSAKPIDEISQKFRKYYKLLLQLREKCKHGVCKLSNVNIKMSSACDSISNHLDNNHDCDVDDFDSDFALSLLANEQEALIEIEAAIKRIYEGTYGICEITGKPIETARLMAVPFTRFSLEGKQQQEKKIKTRQRSGGSIFASEIDDDTPVDYGAEYDE